MTAPEGLPARWRRETARDSHLAALRLARERGFDALTVEAIGAAAGIAPRTFFNYFPTKEAAVVHGPFDLAEPEVAAFSTGDVVPDHSPHRLRPVGGEDGGCRERARCRHRPRCGIDGASVQSDENGYD